MAVVIETTLGDLTVDLFIQERPKACLNFLKLCKLKYYNFNLFHNVEHGFIAQTGDPTGAGDGGESVWGVVEGPHKRYFEGESLPKIRHSEPGLISMVSVGKNMIGSQFFFTLGPDLYSLDGIHCVIGEVAEGHEVLLKLNEAIVDEKFRPYQDIRITHTVILEDPFDDPRGFQIPSRSPSPTPERLKNGRIGADEDIDDTEGKSIQEIQEMLQEREAKARATILEIVGDLPDADIAPPENVLFVCKLNPVTNDDDLEIIFSRFGKVKSCEVIRDKVTGDSLQYAFVEFEDKKACEQAYFKMDNVLIDDRRIHVDFSQSVAKVRWRGKGRGVVHDNSNSSGRLDFNNLRGSKKENTNFDYRDARDKNENSKSSNRREYPEKKRYDERRPNTDEREKHEKNVRRSKRDDKGRFEGHVDRRQNRDDRSRSRSAEKSSYRRINRDNRNDDRERRERDNERKQYRDDRDRFEKNNDRKRNRDYGKDDNVIVERDDRQRFDRSGRNDRGARETDSSFNTRGDYGRARRNEERPGPSQNFRNRDRERYRDDDGKDRRDDRKQEERRQDDRRQEDRRQEEYRHRRREDSYSSDRERAERNRSPERNASKVVSKKCHTEDVSKRNKKRRKKSQSSDSDSSSSSDSEKRKRKKNKKTKKRKKKRKRGSSSSSSSSSRE